MDVKMNVVDRMIELRNLFISLEHTSSKIEKEMNISQLKKRCPELEDDLNFCFEVLAGMHKINFTLNVSDRCPGCGHSLITDGFCYNKECSCYDPVGKEYLPKITFKQFCQPLFDMTDHSYLSVNHINTLFRGYGWFLNSLFNREWRLGIGPSQLEKADISPMLAKKYDPDKIPIDDEYFLTEKLDGNRCVARYNVQLSKWEFFSRSGKSLKVSFDMKDLPKEYIFDGEILSIDQIENPSQENFNTLSGIINSKQSDKTRLIYVIFDLMMNISYKERSPVIREICARKLKNNPSSNVKILPLLAICNKQDLNKTVQYYLDYITSRGGEGVMINLGSWTYQHKRTDKLLKVKNVYTMDMEVINVLPGTGKYTGLVGSLECMICSKNGEPEYHCLVGSGLSDWERKQYSTHPEKIIGKIVEVAYFSLSQDKNTRGTLSYSLRFPRFKGVRNDKDVTSSY